MKPSPLKIKTFQDTIWKYYKKNRRDFPWRETFDPYKILISEVMLQQTQTARVIPKYLEFIQEFPKIESLVQATNEDVLRVWSGLGYNRRALYLKKISEIISLDFKNKLPLEPLILQTLPGIGSNTAGAVYVFSTNKPHVFIETNIRRVFIHEFFDIRSSISDKEILTVIEQTVDKENPREWYYAIMDYGAYLGKIEVNPNRKSKHYTKQSKFEGSLRQVRGKILKILLDQKKLTIKKLEKQFDNKEYLQKALYQLEKEGFIGNTNIDVVELKL